MDKENRKNNAKNWYPKKVTNKTEKKTPKIGI